ncbi:MAG: glycosyltransferase family 4 protein [Synergistaceae bacterium]
MSKKILIVADEPGWIFERHAWEIRKRLTKYGSDIAFRKQAIPQMSQDYDLVYVMDPIPLSHGYPPQDKCIMGLRCEFLYKEHPNGALGLYENGFPGRCVSIKDKCCAFHVVNRNQLEIFRNIVTDKPLFLAQHGIDEEVFCKDVVRNYDHRKIRVGTAGRSSPNKGFEIIKTACQMADAEFVSQQYGAGKRSKENMPNFYQDIDAYVCMSKTEGLNNGIMEAGAMGLPVISTRSGAAEEIIKDGENGFLIDRTAEALSEALMRLRDGGLRKSMGNKMSNEIRKNWTWAVKIKEFERMFDEYFELRK